MPFCYIIKKEYKRVDYNRPLHALLLSVGALLAMCPLHKEKIMDGMILINKERGISSFGVVSRVRKICGIKKVRTYWNFRS